VQGGAGGSWRQKTVETGRGKLALQRWGSWKLKGGLGCTARQKASSEGESSNLGKQRDTIRRGGGKGLRRARGTFSGEAKKVRTR